MEDIVLVGFGGHAKSVADCIKRQNKYTIIGYTDFQENASQYKYLGNDDVLMDLFCSGVKNAVICLGFLGKGDIRERLYKKLKDIGFTLPIIIDPSAIVSDDTVIGEGTFIGKNAVINTEAQVGCCCIINTGAIIEHECRVGDFTHVAVNSVLCGQVKVGKACLIGANATVIQCMNVPDNKIIAAGDVVRKRE